MCVMGIRGSPQGDIGFDEVRTEWDDAVHSGIRSSSSTLFILLGICSVIEMKESWCWKQKEVRISLGMADMKKKFSKSCCGCVGTEILGNLDSSASVEVRWCSSFLTCILASETCSLATWDRCFQVLSSSFLGIWKPVYVRRSYWYKDMLEKDKHYHTEIVFTMLTEVLKNFFFKSEVSLCRPGWLQTVMYPRWQGENTNLSLVCSSFHSRPSKIQDQSKSSNGLKEFVWTKASWN